MTDIWKVLWGRVKDWGSSLSFSGVGWGKGGLQKLKEVSKQKEFEKGWRDNEKCKLDTEFLLLSPRLLSLAVPTSSSQVHRTGHW